VTRQTLLGDRVEVADTARSRNKGLLGRHGLEPGGGLWIVPCGAVHTFFMRFPIDLVYLDRKKRVRKARSRVPAWRISGAFWAHSVVELPAGTIQQSQTVKGDRIEIASIDQAEPPRGTPAEMFHS
jgi:uncharacterized membrane protein (UPF0127 family)